MLVALAGGYLIGERRSAVDVDPSAGADPRRAGNRVADLTSRRWTMKIVMVGLLMVQVIGVTGAGAQTAGDVEIRSSVFEVKTNGAEQPAGGAFSSSAPVSERWSGGARFSVAALRRILD